VVTRVSILGGSGFVGRHVAHELARRDIEVRVLTRARERAKPLIVLPTTEVLTCDVHDAEALSRALQGSDAVINLVGILHETRRSRFADAHVELPRKVLRACEAAGVRRLLHMSALKADATAPSAYLRSKAEAEKLLAEFGESGKAAVTIFRPSVIFGAGDSFLTLFARLVRLLPVVALACPDARFQPVFVEDVARAMVESLDNTHTFGQRYDLCGPKVYRLKELVAFVAAVTGKRRPIVGLGKALSYLQATLMEFAPGKLMTRDNYRSMQIDSVCDCPFPTVFGFEPSGMEAIAADYLTNGSLRRRYQLLRFRAGR
jgi:uncharacterized protein YbjT (DUF2867 family)